jgi:hypothetical protein
MTAIDPPRLGQRQSGPIPGRWFLAPSARGTVPGQRFSKAYKNRLLPNPVPVTPGRSDSSQERILFRGMNGRSFPYALWKSCRQSIQKLSHRNPHRRANQPALTRMLYTQQFWLQKRSDLKFCLQSAKWPPARFVELRTPNRPKCASVVAQGSPYLQPCRFHRMN